MNWQTDDNSIPVGRGPGQIGFRSAVPGAVGIALTSSGPSDPPAFASGATITNVGTPLNPTDAATKQYVDAVAAGLRPQTGVRLATAAVLPNTPTYANGASGVGATLTAGSNTTLTVDGAVCALNDNVLVKNQASAFQNGVYTVTTVGSGAAAWVLTRRTDFDTAAEMLAGSYFFVSAGSALSNTSWTLQSTVTTVGTTSATFVQYANFNAGVASIDSTSGVITVPPTVYTSNVNVTASVLTVNTRPRMAGNLTLFVRKDGSDSNTGLVDNAGGALLTFQRAADIVGSLDGNGFGATIQHGSEGAQTFTANTTIRQLIGWSGLSILGSATPGNTTVTVAGNDCFTLYSSGHCAVSIGQMTLNTGNSGQIQVAYQSLFTLGPAMIFGTANNAHVYVHDRQALALMLNQGYTITGGAATAHVFVNGGMCFNESSAVTITGTPNFPGGFLAATNGGAIQLTNFFHSGAATGPCGAAAANAVINTFGGSGTLPGTAAVTNTGGTFVP